MNKKRIISFVLALVMVLSVLPGQTFAFAAGEDGQVLTLRYDDRYDVSGKAVEIIDAGAPTSYQVGYGVEEKAVRDTAVVTLEGDKLIATGIGTARVSIDGVVHEVKVTAAPISLLLLAGQSNMQGSEGDENQSIVCPDGMVYSTYGDRYTMTTSNATNFVPSALAGEGSEINVNGTTENLSEWPIYLLNEKGVGKKGPDSGFAYEWVKQTGEKVWVVNAAHGGTSINIWQPGTQEYEECQALFTAVTETLRKEIAAGHFTLSHMGYFWCQGCANASDTAKAYVNKYLAVHEGFKSELAFDHDSNPATADKTFEFGGIIPILFGTSSYRAGVNEDVNKRPYYESFELLYYNGPRVAQYWMGNNPDLPDIWNVCTIGETWVWMPDGTNGVSNYFNAHYLNGTVDYVTQVQQADSWYKPTTPKAVHDSIHYNQIGYNEIGRESARNALIMLGELPDYAEQTTVTFENWTGYKEVSQIAASTAGQSSTLVVPVVSPITRSKQVTYHLTEGLEYNFYDLTADSPLISGKLSAVGATGSVEVEGRNLTTYNWELENGILVSAGTSSSPITRLEGSTENGVFIDNRYKLQNAFALLHDQNWVLEWKMTGPWYDAESTASKKIFCEDGASATPNSLCLLIKGNENRISIGYYGSTTHESYGFELDNFGINMTETHVYRLANHINADGTNTIYLFVDGKEIGPMIRYFTGSGGDMGKDSNWLSGKDISFGYLGTPKYLLDNGVIEYITVMESGASSDIHFHDWTVWQTVNEAGPNGPGMEKRSCACGQVEERTINSIWQTTNLAKYFQQLPENTCSALNLWSVLRHDPVYYVNSSGDWGYHSSKNVPSVTIPVKAGDKIFATSFGKAKENGHASSNGIRVTFFDISGVVKTLDPAETYAEFSANGGYLIAPEGAAAVNVPMWDASNDNELYILNTEHTYANGVCTACGEEHPGASAWEGKTIVCIGDSITCGVGVTKDETDYVKLLAEKLGMEYIRLGASGTTLCTGGHRTCNIGKLTEANLAGADVVTILMGINDFNQAREDYYMLGTMESTDSSTIYGAVRMWCEHIAELRAAESLSHTEFFFITPTITNWRGYIGGNKSWDQSKTNIHGYTLRDLCNAIIEVAALYDIPVIDLNLTSGLYYISDEDNSISEFGGDGLHPGVEGHAMMAEAIANALLRKDTWDDHQHSYGSWIATKYPSCQKGTEARVCSVCSAVESRETAANGVHHYVTATVTAPTCTQQGYTTYTCACGDSYVDDYVETVEHTYGPWTELTAPTCSAEGRDMRLCSVCGEAEYRDTRASGSKEYILISEPLPADYFADKTIMCIGDSITAGTGVTSDERYSGVLSELLGATVVNRGTSGAVLSPDGHLPNRFEALMTESVMKNADVVTILLGVNDWNNGVKNGYFAGKLKYDPDATYYDLGEFGTDDTSTIYGAAKMWCERIVELQATEACADTKFVFMTPVILARNSAISSSIRDWDQSKTNAFGHILRTYCEAIMEVCAHYGIPCLDLNLYSGMYYRSETDCEIGQTTDGIHPGVSGHALMANAISEFLLENYSYEERESAHSGHRYTPALTAPTCTDRGYTTYTCACGDSYVDDYVEAAGHNYENGICTVCGEEKNLVPEGWSAVPLTTAKQSSHLGYRIEDGVLTFRDFGLPEREDYGIIPGYTNLGASDEDNYRIAPWYQNMDQVNSVVFDDTISSVGAYVLTNMNDILDITVENAEAEFAGSAILFNREGREEPLDIYAASTISTVEGWIRGSMNRPITQIIPETVLHLVDFAYLAPELNDAAGKIQAGEAVDMERVFELMSLIGEALENNYSCSNYVIEIDGAEGCYEVLQALTAGTCGDGVSYSLHVSEAGGALELVISGSGIVEAYAAGRAPWSPMADSITDVTIDDAVVLSSIDALPTGAVFHLRINSASYTFAKAQGLDICFDELRVLLIGNSHTRNYSSHLTNILRDMTAAGMETKITIDKSITGSIGLYSGRNSNANATYRSHLEGLGMGASAYELLSGEKYDLIIVQDYLESMIDTPEDFTAGLASFLAKVEEIIAENEMGTPEIAWFADWVDIRNTGGDSAVRDNAGDSIKLEKLSREEVYAKSLDSIAAVEMSIARGESNMPDFVIQGSTIKQNAMSSYLGSTLSYDNGKYCLLESDTTHLTDPLGCYILGAGVMAALSDHYGAAFTSDAAAVDVAAALSLANSPSGMDEATLAVVREAVSNPKTFVQSAYTVDPITTAEQTVLGMEWELSNTVDANTVADAIAEVIKAEIGVITGLSVTVEEFGGPGDFSAVVTLAMGYSKKDIEVEVSSHIHTYTPTVTAPTCTEKGHTTYTCTCGDSYVDDYTDPRPYRILLIGNSFSWDAADAGYGLRNSQMYDVINAMLKDECSAELGVVVRGSTKLSYHYSMIEDAKDYKYTKYSSTGEGWTPSVPPADTCISEVLESEAWDAVVIQPYREELTGGNNAEESISNLLDYLAEHEAGAKIYYYMPWSATDQSNGNTLAKYEEIAAYTELTVEDFVSEGGNAFAGVIPVGTGIQNARTTYLDDLHYAAESGADPNVDSQRGLERDKQHVSFGIGRYIAGVIMAEILIPQDMRREEYALPDIKDSAAIGPMPREYNAIARLAAEYALGEPYAVTDISGYDTDPAEKAVTEIEAAEYAFEGIGGEAELLAAVKTLVESCLDAEDFAEPAIVISEYKLSDGGSVESLAAEVTLRYGYTTKTANIQTHTHSYTPALTAPTCTEKGYTTYTCSCGDSYVADYVEATGIHTYEDAACTQCGAILYGDVNGDGSITVRDLALLRKYLANKDPATGESTVAVAAGADANGADGITVRDLAMLRKYLANKDPETGESSVVLGPQN